MFIDHHKIFKVGQTWRNDRDYKMKILAIGVDQLWLEGQAVYNDGSGNKSAWDMDKFLIEYTLYQREPDDVPEKTYLDDKEFILWIIDRLVLVHKDNENSDFIARLKKIAKSVPKTNV